MAPEDLWGSHPVSTASNRPPPHPPTSSSSVVSLKKKNPQGQSGKKKGKNLELAEVGFEPTPLSRPECYPHDSLIWRLRPTRPSYPNKSRCESLTIIADYKCAQLPLATPSTTPDGSSSDGTSMSCQTGVHWSLARREAAHQLAAGTLPSAGHRFSSPSSIRGKRRRTLLVRFLLLELTSSSRPTPLPLGPPLC